jgi:hypothetical protein
MTRLESERLNVTDSRDTGEHFLGPLTDQPGSGAQVSARRVADLSTQLRFLDREIGRYRDLLEQERIRHATEMANLQLESDTRLDEMRREERARSTALHDSYRALLSERQIEFEQSLSEAAATNAAELANERNRYHQTLKRDRNRRDALLESIRKQTLDEADELYHSERQALASELLQSTATNERLQVELEAQIARADRAESRAAQAEIRLSAVDRTLDRSEARSQLRIDEAERQLVAAADRLEWERQRSAATLAELLERSASIAAEADKARSDLAALQAKAEHAAASAQQLAKAEYQSLVAAADERASRALQRESDLEAAIAELRAQLPPHR